MTEPRNPYLPPEAKVEAESDDAEREIANKGRRFGTFVVDYIGIMLLGFVLGIALVLIYGPAVIESLQRVPALVKGIVLFLLYYIPFEAIWARTPGKWVFGTEVITLDGTKPSFGIILGRTLCRFIPFEVLSFLGRDGWHDRFSGTQVVRVRLG